MRYFFDTEFIEDGKTIDLISIGIVAEDGRAYYAQVQSLPTLNDKVTDWIARNVLPSLTHYDMGRRARECAEAGRWGDDYTGKCRALNECPWRPRNLIATDIKSFVARDGSKPEFWAYYADYDWVVLCQLFGTMMDLPKGWTMYCRDIKQLADDLGNPTLPEQGKGEHNALADAQWNKVAWDFLQGIKAKTEVA